MKNLQETKFTNAGHVKEFIDELEEFPEKNEEDLLFLYKIYNKFVKKRAYKLYNDRKTIGKREEEPILPLNMEEKGS